MDEQKNIICSIHKGKRFIDTIFMDIRTVCDKCGNVEQTDFPPISVIPSQRSDYPICPTHSSVLQLDLLGFFCVWCIIERSQKELEHNEIG